MNNFVDDPNYEVRLASLKILNVFIQKLGPNVNQCYKVICNCARQVMSQTHQSKTLKQSLNNMLLVTIENMKNPILVLECLLDKIKDRSAKAREEFLNIIITAVLKFPNDKFDSLRKIFFQVAPLLCDIKRNVRHAALECIAVLYSKLKMAVSLDFIVKIETIFDMGVYAPLTESGTLAVNSIFASCYANTLWHNLAHLFFYPIIQISKYFNIDALNQYMENTWSQIKNEDDKTKGIFWYAKFFHSIVDYIPFSSSLVAF